MCPTSGSRVPSLSHWAVACLEHQGCTDWGAGRCVGTERRRQDVQRLLGERVPLLAAAAFAGMPSSAKQVVVPGEKLSSGRTQPLTKFASRREPWAAGLADLGTGIVLHNPHPTRWAGGETEAGAHLTSHRGASWWQRSMEGLL